MRTARRPGDYFVRAIAVDPGYALAHADLSDIYRSLASSSLVDPCRVPCRRRGRPHGERWGLDENLAEGHYALANLLTYAWQWAGAEGEYKRAIMLNPNLALAHRWYAGISAARRSPRGGHCRDHYAPESLILYRLGSMPRWGSCWPPLVDMSRRWRR